MVSWSENYMYKLLFVVVFNYLLQWNNSESQLACNYFKASREQSDTGG